MGMGGKLALRFSIPVLLAMIPSEIGFDAFVGPKLNKYTLLALEREKEREEFRSLD